MLYRDRAAVYFGPIKGAVKSIFGMGFFAIAFLFMGLFGGSDAGGMPIERPFKNLRNARVFAAAPSSTNRVVPENLAFSKLYAPPLYRSVASLNLQPRQSKPSKGWPTLEKVKSSKIGVVSSGIKEGIAPTIETPVPALATPPPWKIERRGLESLACELRGADAATIGTRLFSINPQHVPKMNAPTAMIVLDMTPPLPKLRGIIVRVVSSLAWCKTTLPGPVVRNEIVAKISPMNLFKDTVVINSSVDDQIDGIPIVRPTHIQIGMKGSLWSYNTMTWKNMFFQRSFSSLGHWLSNDFNREIFCWSPSGILENKRHGPIAIFFGIYRNITDSHPSSLIDSEIIVGLLNRFASLAQQPVSERGIDDESYQSQKLKPKYPTVITVSSFVIGVIMMW
ncbi:MAG TPA: hypothetical protein VN943_15480 [Candidatus Acidoferrum sp.]|nr:hypothetical protein [Candidatus Acidoferrum sp.]